MYYSDANTSLAIAQVSSHALNGILAMAYTRATEQSTNPGKTRFDDLPSQGPLDSEYGCLLTGSQSPVQVTGFEEIPASTYSTAVSWKLDDISRSFKRDDIVGLAHTHHGSPALSDGDLMGIAQLREELANRSHVEMVIGRRYEFTIAAYMAFEDDATREVIGDIAVGIARHSEFGRELLSTRRPQIGATRLMRSYVNTVVDHFTKVAIKYNDSVIRLYNGYGEDIPFRIEERSIPPM